MTVEPLSPLGELVGRYFLLQEERPSGIEEVEIGSLDPFLRGLLFTDGTVTRALAVQLLAPVSVRPLSQEEVAVPAALAAHLEAPAGERAVRRRVAIGSGPAIFLWAESHLLPGRLPADFFGELRSAPDGIGQSVQQAALENYRELLWFGFDRVPSWASRDGEATTIRRLYRLVSKRQASILISESFLVEWSGGVCRLAAAASGPDADPPVAGGGR